MAEYRGITFQPSEFFKITLVIVLAAYFAGHGEYSEYRLRDLWRPLLLIMVPFLLIVKQPDLGTALILVVVSFSIIHVHEGQLEISADSHHDISVISPFCMVLSLKEYQQKRILSFINPDSDPLGSGYHIITVKNSRRLRTVIGEGAS